ncbi:TIGR02710 family CRISPR-associated CARF protein [Methanothermobacter sp. DP]|uniref:TIGR02710 family CRISPR-associated CARF protein n=1 Tax=Methanothermobacter sp. DP TaxID=2998972 RepID=UPI002AA57E07|nr:TIGR02710 family CRISPR-associated CARF protein [Methanothermobacter sp. DP]
MSNRILFMTVGTGVGDSEERVRSLAHGLLSSIHHNRPDRVIFFGSDKSRKTVEYISEEAKREGKVLPEYEFVEVNDIDLVGEWFTSIDEQMKRYSDDEIIVDYTSGTKTMTSIAFIMAVLYGKELSVISGFRDKNGTVQSGTETVIKQNVYQIYDKLRIRRFRELFNLGRFKTALDVLNEVVQHEKKDAYIKLTEAYLHWDLFDHERAMEYLNSEEVKELEELEDVVTRNKNILGQIVSSRKGKRKFRYRPFLPDLFANSKRRASEGRYDDAAARLYRALELIAQIVIEEEYGDETDSLNPDNYSLSTRSTLKLGAEKHVALKNAYRLLECEGYEVGKTFGEDKEIMDLLKIRNYSILAHGLDSVTEDDYLRFYERVLGYARIIDDKIDSKIEDATFPEL